MRSADRWTVCARAMAYAVLDLIALERRHISRTEHLNHTVDNFSFDWLSNRQLRTEIKDVAFVDRRLWNAMAFSPFAIFCRIDFENLLFDRAWWRELGC